MRHQRTMETTGETAMSDTNGYEPEPADVEAFLADGDGWGGDPLPMYVEATKAQVLHQAVAERWALRRATLLAQMNACGVSYQQIADVTGLSRPRVQQLVERGRAPDGSRRRRD